MEGSYLLLASLNNSPGTWHVWSLLIVWVFVLYEANSRHSPGISLRHSLIVCSREKIEAEEREVAQDPRQGRLLEGGVFTSSFATLDRVIWINQHRILVRRYSHTPVG